MSVQLAGNTSAYGKEKFNSYIYPNGSERHIAIGSGIISASENNCAELKIVCIYFFGAQTFYKYLYGWHFTMYTDHKHHDNTGPKSGVPTLAAARLH